MKTSLRLLLLFVACAWSAQTQAEDKSADNVRNQIVFRLADGRDSLVQNVKFAGIDSVYHWQEMMEYIVGTDSLAFVDSKEAKAITRNGQDFIGADVLQPDGSTQALFALRYYSGEKDAMPSLYQIYDSNGKFQYYIQQPGEEVLRPMTTAKGSRNAFQEALIAKNESCGGNAEITDYVGNVRIDRPLIKQSLKMIRKQNPNLIGRFRYGLGAGVSVNTCDLSKMLDYKSSQTQFFLKAFLDLRNSSGFSLHPELTWLKYASHKVTVSNVMTGIYEFTEIAYNNTEITFPLMIRYTAVQLRGNWLPYVEGGLVTSFTVKNNCLSRCISDQSSGYMTTSEVESVDTNEKVLFAPMLGLGVEYRFSRKHSLFFETQLFAKPEKAGNALVVNRSAWMTSVSMNL